LTVSASGRQLPKGGACEDISADGRFVVLRLGRDVYLRDRLRKTTTVISVSSNEKRGNRGSGDATISSDGRFVAFASTASNLVSGDSYDGYSHIFLRDVIRGTTQMASRSGANAKIRGDSPSISANGRFIAFHGTGGIFVRDRIARTSTEIPIDGYVYTPVISADGRHVAFQSNAELVTDDPNGGRGWDTFVHDLTTRTTELASRSEAGDSGSSNTTGMSADGRFVAYASDASDLVPGDTNQRQDIFVYDRETKTVTRVVSGTGDVPNNTYTDVTMTPDGRYLAFHSMYQIVPDKRPQRNCMPETGDRRTCFDVYIHDLRTERTFAVSRRSAN
jgi:Tol biopolymer transport system component